MLDVEFCDAGLKRLYMDLDNVVAYKCRDCGKRFVTKRISIPYSFLSRQISPHMAFDENENKCTGVFYELNHYYPPRDNEKSIHPLRHKWLMELWRDDE